MSSLKNSTFMIAGSQIAVVETSLAFNDVQLNVFKRSTYFVAIPWKVVDGTSSNFCRLYRRFWWKKRQSSSSSSDIPTLWPFSRSIKIGFVKIWSRRRRQSFSIIDLIMTSRLHHQHHHQWSLWWSLSINAFFNFLLYSSLLLVSFKYLNLALKSI